MTGFEPCMYPLQLRFDLENKVLLQKSMLVETKDVHEVTTIWLFAARSQLFMPLDALFIIFHWHHTLAIVPPSTILSLYLFEE